jgi:predicted transcriptional regulator
MIGEAGTKGIGPTRLMYQVNLSYVTRRYYTHMFIANGLVEEFGNSTRKRYRLTTKGKNAVAAYSDFKKFIRDR